MLSRLATKEWFTARISSSGLLSLAYLKLTKQQQEEHLTLFAQLCQDDTPMVRRVAAQFLGKMVENVVEAYGRSSLEEEGAVSKILIPLYEELASNEQPVSLFGCDIVCLFSSCLTNSVPICSRILCVCKPHKTVLHLGVSWESWQDKENSQNGKLV